MKRWTHALQALLLGTCLVVTTSHSFAREPQTAAPEAKPTPKGYDATIRVEPLLVTSETASGAPIVYPTTDQPEVRILRVTVPAGASTGWHLHPVPAYGYVISGEITVELADGRKNTVKAGEALAEVVDTLHNGTNTGSEPVVILMVVTGEKGKPVTIAGEAPAREGESGEAKD